MLNLDELENSEKTSKANKSPDSNKASKKSDDTNDYLDDDDDDDEDDPDDDHDDTTNNSENGPNRSKDAQNVNEIDESDSDTNSNQNDDYKGENKNTKTELTKQYQEQNIAWSTDTPVSKPIQNTVQSGLNKTPLDKSKSIDIPASDAAENNQAGLSKEGDGLSDNGNTMKPQASRVSQESPGVPPGSTVGNNDNSNEQSSDGTSPLDDGLSNLPKSGSSVTTQSDGTNKLAGNTEEDSGQSADSGDRNTGTMENNASGTLNTQASNNDGNDDEKSSQSTTDTETDDTDEMNEHSDGEISGNKSAMENGATDSSNSGPNVKTTPNIVTPTVENGDQKTANPSKDDDSSTMEKDTDNSATTDKDAQMKQLNRNAENTQPSGTTVDDDNYDNNNETSSSTASSQNGLPNKQEMKAVSGDTILKIV